MPAPREAGYTDQVQSIRIEYCRKRDAKRNWVRHGPCIVRGPNDERYEVGEYVDGQRDGVWRRWGPSQTSETRYDHGRYVGVNAATVGYPDSVTIDAAIRRPRSIMFHAHSVASPFPRPLNAGVFSPRTS